MTFPFSAALTNIHSAWTEAFARRDVIRLAALYTHDAAFYGSAPQLSRGREGVRRYFTELSPRFKLARFGDAAIVGLAPTVFAASGPVEFTTEQGSVLAIHPYRMTHVLTLLGGIWLIATHHASPVPPT